MTDIIEFTGDLGLTPFDPAAYLTSDAAQAALLADASESGDAAYIKHALAIVARAQGMTKVAAEIGMPRQQLHRALAAKGNPTLDTLAKVTHALGFRLRIEPIDAHGGPLAKPAKAAA